MITTLLFNQPLRAQTAIPVASGLLNSPTTNGNCIVSFDVTGSSAVSPTCSVPGVTVNAQSGNYSLIYSDRVAYLKFSGGTTATLTLCQITGTCASNFPFVLQNLNSGTLTITSNAADKIDNGTTGGSISVPPNTAAFVYQDSSSAPGNWWTIRVPNASVLVPGQSSSSTATWVRVTADFTTTSSSLVAITGLSWTLPANTAANYHYECNLVAGDSSTSASLNWGIQDVTTAPTNATVNYLAATSTTTVNTENNSAITTTTATGPAATYTPTVTSNIRVQLFGTVEQPSGAASVFQIMGQVSGGATLTVKRGSACGLWQVSN